MAKYNYELKKKVVKAYLDGEGGYEYLAKKYKIPASLILKKGFFLTNTSEMVVICVLESKKNILLNIRFM